MNQECRSSLVRQLWLKVFHKDEVRWYLGLQLSDGLGWGQISFQTDSLTWLASWCWLIAEDLNSSPSGTIHQPARVSSWHTDWHTSEQVILRASLKVTRSHQYAIGQVLASSVHCGRGLYKGVNTRGQRSFGDHHGGKLLHRLRILPCENTVNKGNRPALCGADTLVGRTDSTSSKAFTNATIQQIFTKSQLCIQLCARPWVYNHDKLGHTPGNSSG